MRSSTPFHQVTDSHAVGNDNSNSTNEGNDITLGGNAHFKQRPRFDPLQDIFGPKIRLRAKKMKEALVTLIQTTQVKKELKLQDFSSYVVNVLIADINGPYV